MKEIRSIHRTVVTLVAVCALALLAPGGMAGCGDNPINRDNSSGVVAGLALKTPLSLDEAWSLSIELGGDLVALYRTDYADVQAVNTGAPGQELELVASRFAYTDAYQLREDREEAIYAGLAPQPEGLHISESYWQHWEDQWRQAQEPGVRFEAMALYVREEALGALRSDARFQAVEIIPHRRTDSISSDYPGELLLESESFPAGVLTEPAPNGAVAAIDVEQLPLESGYTLEKYVVASSPSSPSDRRIYVTIGSDYSLDGGPRHAVAVWEYSVVDGDLVTSSALLLYANDIPVDAGSGVQEALAEAEGAVAESMAAAGLVAETP